MEKDDDKGSHMRHIGGRRVRGEEWMLDIKVRRGTDRVIVMRDSVVAVDTQGRERPCRTESHISHFRKSRWALVRNLKKLSRDSNKSWLDRLVDLIVVEDDPKEEESESWRM